MAETMSMHLSKGPLISNSQISDDSSISSSKTFLAKVVAHLLTEFLPRFEVEDLMHSGSGFSAFAAAVSAKAIGNPAPASFLFIEEIIKVVMSFFRGYHFYCNLFSV